jgi:aryl-phospho-beta-D-glucosidase BglC (GH1 family)
MVHGTPDARWMGRGVNLDDIYLCGYNYMLNSLDGGTALSAIASSLVTTWKPTFVRVSLGMASYPVQSSWTANAAQYKTPMTSVIEGMGAHPGVYVLVTLRSEATMMGQDTADGDAEATGIPSTATDATYTALVDTFAHDNFVLFGITNEPGGNKQTSVSIASAMQHAVTTIRAEEDHLGVPHHVISVQGNAWTSDISYYATTPIASDNIVYEVHGYPPATASYTYANLPVIIGEYGTLADSAAFFADLETKQIPNLAWDFEPYSDCAPDLLNVNQSSTNLVPSTWGSTVKTYLLAHAP